MRFLGIGESDGRSDGPGTVFGRMGAFTLVVVLKALAKICCAADVKTTGPAFALIELRRGMPADSLQNVDVGK